MSDYLIMFLVSALAFVCVEIVFIVFEKLVGRKLKRGYKEDFYDLMEEFDEMDYSPTTFCENPEKTREIFKKRLITNYEKTYTRSWYED